MDEISNVFIVIVPAFLMAYGEYSGAELGRRVQSCCQNLSAGLILGSLSSEIQPLINEIVSQEDGLRARFFGMLALLVGSAISLAFNFYVSSLEQDDFSSCIISRDTAESKKSIEKVSVHLPSYQSIEAIADVETCSVFNVIVIKVGLIKELCNKLLQETLSRSLFDSHIHLVEVCNQIVLILFCRLITITHRQRSMKYCA